MKSRPSVQASKNTCDTLPLPRVLDGGWLKTLATECGADDVGLVEVTREALAGEREDIESMLPGAKTVVCIARRINKDAIRNPWMGVVNREHGFVHEAVDDIASNLAHQLLGRGIRCAPAHVVFPMDTQKWSAKMWPISHKIVSEQAGLGRQGHNRLLIHPRFGSSMLLSAVVLDREAAEYDQPLEEHPCNGCKRCVAVCPTGSIRKDGSFSFANCATHNYRYRMGGFNDWVENVVESKDKFGYRRRVSFAETMSTWQALAYASNYTCLNCLSVCPVGDERTSAGDQGSPAPTGKALIKQLRDRATPVFVLRGSDAETHAERSYPPDDVIQVGSGLRPLDAAGFLDALPLLFQPGKANGLQATYHFEFSGEQPVQGTVVIADGQLQVRRGLDGEADLTVKADGATWVSFLTGEARLLPALLRRRVRIRGRPSLMNAFARCFPA